MTLAQSDGSSTTIQGSLVFHPEYQLSAPVLLESHRTALTGFGQGKMLIGSDVVRPMTRETRRSRLRSRRARPRDSTSRPRRPTRPATRRSSPSMSSIQGQINLILSATATPNPVLAGGELTYTLTVTNQGNIPADGVIADGSASRQRHAGLDEPSVKGSSTPHDRQPRSMANLGTIPAGGSATTDDRGPDGRQLRRARSPTRPPSRARSPTRTPPTNRSPW